MDAVARRSKGLGRADCKRQSVRYSSRGHDRAGHRANRSRPDPDRSGLHLEQESTHRIAKIFSRRNRPWQTRGPEKGQFRGARSAGARSKERRGTRPRRPGDQLERSRGPLRQIENGAAGAEHGLARSRAGLSQQPANWQSHLDDLVTNPEKNDRARLYKPRAFHSWHHAERRNDGGSRTTHSLSESGAHAIFQPAAQDRGPDYLKFASLIIPSQTDRKTKH